MVGSGDAARHYVRDPHPGAAVEASAASGDSGWESAHMQAAIHSLTRTPVPAIATRRGIWRSCSGVATWCMRWTKPQAQPWRSMKRLECHGIGCMNGEGSFVWMLLGDREITDLNHGSHLRKLGTVEEDLSRGRVSCGKDMLGLLRIVGGDVEEALGRCDPGCVEGARKKMRAKRRGGVSASGEWLPRGEWGCPAGAGFVRTDGGRGGVRQWRGGAEKQRSRGAEEQGSRWGGGSGGGSWAMDDHGVRVRMPVGGVEAARSSRGKCRAWKVWVQGTRVPRAAWRCCGDEGHGECVGGSWRAAGC
jgi:hypothetical protein